MRAPPPRADADGSGVAPPEATALVLILELLMCINCTIQPTPAQDSALTRRRMLGLGAAGLAGAAMTTLGPVAPAAAAPRTLQSRDREEQGQRRVPVDSISIQLYTLPP
jgi:hypothetical protein